MSRRVFIVANVGLILLAAAGSLLAQPQQGNRYSVPFSDPSRPGTVRINLMHSSITVKSANGREVVVVSRAHDAPRRPAPADSSGLRRLNPPTGLNIQEENNVLTIHGTWPSGPADIEVEVPVKTNLMLHAMTGDVMVEGVDGEIEATTMTGSIALTNVSGSVVAHANNGRIAATVVRVTPDRPMAFTALNGNVDVTLPAAVKADLKLRSNLGDVFSDFDVQLKPGAPPPSGARGPSRGGYRFVADRSIYGSVNGGGPLFELRTINGNVYLRKAKGATP